MARPRVRALPPHSNLSPLRRKKQERPTLGLLSQTCFKIKHHHPPTFESGGTRSYGCRRGPFGPPTLPHIHIPSHTPLEPRFGVQETTGALPVPE